MHRYRVQRSKDGTYKRVGEKLIEMVERKREKTANPSAGVVDARSVRGAPTVTSPTRGYDAVKKI